MNSATKEVYDRIRRGLLAPTEAVALIAALRQGGNGAHPAVAPPERTLFRYDEPILRDHLVGGKQVLIGVAHASLVIEAHFARTPADSPVALRQLTFVKPIEVEPRQTAEVEVVEDERAGAGAFRVRFRLDASSPWEDTATGRYERPGTTFGRQDLASLSATGTRVSDLSSLYDAGEPFFHVGPSFRTIRQLLRAPEAALAEVDLTSASGAAPRPYRLHPLLTYSAFTALLPLLDTAGFTHAFLPFGIRSLDFRGGPAPAHVWVVVRGVRNTGEMVFFDADIVTPDGDEVARLRGCSIKRLRERPTALEPNLAERPRSIEPSGLASSNDERKIREFLLRALDLASRNVPLDANLMELGLGSAQLVETARKLAAETGLPLDPTLFFEFPTVRELTRYFVERHPERFATVRTPAPETARPLPERAALAPIPNPAAKPSPAASPTARDGIAVIGMDGRFADADNLERFWELLRQGSDLVDEVPLDHWDYRPWFDPEPGALDKTYCKWGSFIDGVDRFDPAFFGIPAQEANWLDPQVRLLLQSVQAAAEHAGAINRLRGSATGVFVGLCSTDYQDRIAELRLPVDPRRTGVSGSDTAANRVSYWLDLKGPSLVFNTACSSSLVALHYACQAIRNGECRMAFVSGVNLLLDSRHYRHFSAIGALSPSGRCRPFSADADGYVPGECVGTVLLKPLSEALRDGDPIHAVLRGSAALHAGHAPSLTAPSVTGQENVLVKAWEDAGIDPRTLSYVECHGTGTKLGDSIELAALAKALNRFQAPANSCAVGSIKANLGHTEGAAGIAGLLKVILQMKHREIPSLPHFQKPSEFLRLNGSPLFIRAQAGSWESEGGPLRAGVSAFGFSGAYAHVVVEEAPTSGASAAAPSASAGPVPIVLSAKDPDRLRAAARNLAEYLHAKPGLALEQVAYTLQTGRQAMEERLAFVTDCLENARETLNAFVNSPSPNCALLRGRVSLESQGLADLADDEEMQATLEAWFRKGKHSRLLELWVRGGSIDWRKLQGATHPSVVPLPTYPFAQERCWLPESDVSAAPPTTERPAQPTAEGAAAEGWEFHPVGVKAAPPEEVVTLPASDKAAMLVRQSVADWLGCSIAEVALEHPFLHLPLGSLGLVELSRSLGAFLASDLSPAQFFEHSTVGALAGHLAQTHAAALNRLQAVRRRAKTPPAPVPSPTPTEFPLSEGQLGLWALQKANPGMGAYNCPLCFQVGESLDAARFRDACRFLLEQHPLLSRGVEETGDAPVLVPRSIKDFAVAEVDGRTWTEGQLRAWIQSAIRVPFDLGRDLLLRAALIATPGERTVVLLTVHHLVFDGSSFPILLRTLLDAYRALRSGRRPAAVTAQGDYRDYVQAERARLSGNDGAARWAFWKDHLAGEHAPLEMAWDFPKTSSQPFAGRTVSRRISPELSPRIESFARDHGVYPSAVFLAAFLEFLHLYSRQSDVTIGMPVNERSDPRFAAMIGYFVNLVPIRGRELGQRPFVEFAQRLQQTVLAALTHRIPFPALVRELGLAGQGDHPLVQAAFEYQNFLRPEDVRAVEQSVEQTFPMTWLEDLHQEGEYELALEVIELQAGFQLNLKYNPTLLREATALRMLEHLQALLESALTDPRRIPSTDLLLPDAERWTLLHEWNDTRQPYPREACIHEFFERQAARTPEAVAVVFGSRTVSYRELDSLGTAWAVELQRLGVGPDSVVGLFLERSVELIVSLLAVLKAGGAYLPLDPDYPEERLAFMVEDSRTAWILTQSHLAPAVARFARPVQHVLLLDQPSKAGAAGRAKRRKLEPGARAENLACVLYTSGSTGNPKGVLTEHRALCNRILWMQRDYPLSPADRVLQKTPYSFDVSGWEFHWPLLAGARLIVAAPGKHKDPEYLWDIVEAEGITVLHFVPAMLQAFLSVDREHRGASLRHVFCSGEELTPAQVARFFERFAGAQLHNLYGPTEAAIDVSAKRCEPGAVTVPIGKPIANVQLHVVDDRPRLLPIGFVGELCIAGDGLARGYLNRPELTAERFVPNPFENGARMYRTGDLARWTTEGEIEFLGRIDHQIKIRGCRVELGEIETALTAIEPIREAVVVAQGTSQDRKLVAFCVAPPASLDAPRLRHELRRRLPEHMIPSEFVAMDRLPVTASGKVDRRSLANRPASASPAGTEGKPRTPAQERLVALWREALGRDAVGIQDSFFDLGGHSLSALSLMAKINAAFGARLPLATLFEARCIADLAARLEGQADPNANPALIALERGGSEPPLFLAPGIGSTGVSFVPLGRALAPSQPVYLLQPPGLEGEREPLATVPELAAYYLEHLPPPGPSGYRLGGWSMGGVVAFEMACQLAARGQKVEQIILIDSYLAEFLLRLGRLPTSPRAAGALALTVPGQAAGPATATVSRHHARVLEAQERAFASYRPTRSYTGSVLYFRATNLGEDPRDASADLPTGAATPSDAEIVEIVQQSWLPHLPRIGERFVSLTGTHESILRAPAVTELAREIQACLAGHRQATGHAPLPEARRPEPAPSRTSGGSAGRRARTGTGKLSGKRG